MSRQYAQERFARHIRGIYLGGLHMAVGGAAPAGLGGNPGAPGTDGGTAQMEQMMQQQNDMANKRSMLNIKDQGVKETIQAINTAAKAGHDQQQEVNRNLK